MNKRHFPTPSHAILMIKKKYQSRTYLGVQSFLDADASLDASLTTLDLSHDTLNVLQLIVALPEHSSVLDHL
jgi:hypothetical protein